MQVAYPEPATAKISSAVAYSGLSRTTLWRLSKAGKVRIIKVGRSTLCGMASLRAYLASAPSAA